MERNRMEIYTHMTANGVELEPNDFKKEIPLEGYLIENPAVLSLNLEGDLLPPEIISSQIAIKSGRPSKLGDGRVDLLGYYGESKTLGVIEVKAGKLCNEHLHQLEDYLMKRSEILNKAKDDLKDYGVGTKDLKWVGVLVGTSIEPDLQKKISSGHVADSEVPVAALVIRRFKGQKDGSVYVVSESFFKNKSRKYDQTKYEFRGTKYNKCQLVYAVLKYYITANPECDCIELANVFQKKLQGPWGVFRRKEDVGPHHKQFFDRPGELLILKDAEIAVCGEWGIGNIGNFLEKCKELGFDIKPIKSE